MNRLMIYFCLLITFSVSIYGQENDKIEEILINNEISGNGKYISFFTRTDSKKLIAKTVEGKLILERNNVSKSSFYDDILVYSGQDNITIVDLKKQVNDEVIKNYNQWIYFKNNVIIFISKDYRSVMFYDYSKRKYKEIQGISNYVINKFNKTLILYKMDNTVEIWDNMNSSFQYDILEGALSDAEIRCFKNTFIIIGKNSGRLWCYNSKYKKTFILFDDTFDFSYNLRSKVLMLSENTILFDAFLNTHQDEDEFEYWSSKSGVMIKNQLRDQSYPYVFSYDFIHKKLEQISSSSEDFYIGTQGISMKVKNIDNFTKFSAQKNISIAKSSKDTLLKLDMFNGNRGRIFFSKYSDAILFFKGNSWKIVNSQNTLINLKNSFRYKFIPEDEYKYLDPDPVKGNFFIGQNGNLYFHEMNDILKYNVNTKRLTRITDGDKENKIVKIDKASAYVSKDDYSYDFDYILKNEGQMLLHWMTEDYTKEGLDLLLNDSIIPLVESKAHYNQILYNHKGVSYLKESSNQPAALYFYDFNSKKEVELYQSNSYDNCNDFESIYEQWLSSDGTKRGAIIRLPKNKGLNEKLPAIVNIYEKKYKEQNLYRSPYTLSGSAFNYRDYVSDNYIIIEPDIYYEIGNPGYSAYKCTLESINYLKDKYPIDTVNLGLIGHSFGGYETNFILTQTNVFKTAVSSSGISDLWSWYLSINHESKRPEFWRFEDHIFKMKDNIYEAPFRYLKNSPVFLAYNIGTPLLLWTGKNDHQVNTDQSIELFLALKRLEKTAHLIFVPEEGHVLSKSGNKAKMRNIVKDWFDYYLKNKTKPLWINK